jgi:hypothetical protein
MPRRERPDLRPIIRLPKRRHSDEITHAIQKLKQHLSGREYIEVRQRPSWDTERYLVIYDENLESRLTYGKRKGMKVDEGLLHRLFRMVQLARANRYIPDPAKTDETVDYYRLNPGCRIQFETLKTLSEKLGVSLSHLNANLAVFRDLQIVVRSGHGWIDFDPGLVWRGKSEYRDAYCNTLASEPESESTNIGSLSV